MKPSPVHCPRVYETEIANKTKTTTSETTVTPKKPLVKGPFALSSFTMAIALAGERAVIIAAISIAIPVLQPLFKPEMNGTMSSELIRALMTPVTRVNVRTEMQPTVTKMFLKRSRSSGR